LSNRACDFGAHHHHHSNEGLALSREASLRAARHAEVARRYAWHAIHRQGNAPRSGPAKLQALIRLRELERIYRDRWGYILPDDDSGRDDLELAAHHIAHLRGEVEKHIIAWASRWCPWMSRAEAKALAKRIAGSPLKFKASTLGWRLRLTELERTELAITTIRAFNMTDEQMIERRRQRDRERKARCRLAKRSSRPAPLNQTMPWKGAGISRATWYRRRKAAVETKSVRSRGDLIAADGICLTAHGHRASKVSWGEGLATKTLVGSEANRHRSRRKRRVPHHPRPSRCADITVEN
jgi:hypothetical protein